MKKTNKSIIEIESIYYILLSIINLKSISSFPFFFKPLNVRVPLPFFKFKTPNFNGIKSLTYDSILSDLSSSEPYS